MRPTTPIAAPACPNCGSHEHVVRIPASLTPFERPERDDFDQAHYYCHTCTHDFVPDVHAEDE